MKKILKRSTAILLAIMMIVSTMTLTTVAQGPVNGFGQENGNWYYYQNSQIDTSRNDVIQGTVNGQDGWWYVVGGQVQLNYTGVANYANNYGWWYIKDGKVDFGKTSIEPNQYGWWRVVNGKVDFSCNSVEQNDYGWWYVVGGKVQFDFTGLAEYGNDYGWWYIENGKVNFDHNCVDQNSYGWWYVVGSKVQFNFTGLANYGNEYGWWYIENGKVNFDHNCVDQNNYGWWYVAGSQVQFGYTGVANHANEYGWWYIKDGKVDFSKTGIEQNVYGWWRVVNGKVNFSCNSVEQNDYGWWYLVGGQVQFGYTGVADYANDYGWWYIEGGKVNFNYTGTASNSYGTWYVVNGKVDFSRVVANSGDPDTGSGSSGGGTGQSEPAPDNNPSDSTEVDYSLAENWAYYASAEGETKADVFFVCPTVYSGTDDACNMDIEDDSVRSSFLGAINMEKGIYDEDTRFFAPYYRQAGLNVYEMEDEEEMEPYLDFAYADVKDAFLYYMEEENDGNPIILAGFSQGADMCIRLLKDCFADEEMQDLLVACYAIGWRITEEEMEEYPYLTFAEGADDTGVIIAFDAEDPEIDDSIIIPKGTKSLCINPLTWSTDTAVADKSLNLGACFTRYSGEIRTEIPEFTGAYIDEERGALKVTDVSPEEYPSTLPTLFKDGSYHTYDYEFFYRNLQENVQTRINAYLG